jgi:GrpB-like predicted nucleotidyltransferase (UPF0157 family)
VDTPVDMRDVRELAGPAELVVACFRGDVAPVLGDAEVHHIGATSLPFGHTKGDVDVNIRVPDPRFAAAVAALRAHYDVAQPENWTPTFASFSVSHYALPLGLQVTANGSPDDFLLALRDRMRADEELLRRYDNVKLEAASGGPRAYWEAKNAFLQAVLAKPGL